MKRDRDTVKLLTYYGGAPVARVGPNSVDSFPLADARPGDYLCLDEASGSLGLSCRDRLGLHQGAMLQVIKVRPSGSVIFAVDGREDRQIGVGAALAQQIWVSHQRQSIPASSHGTDNRGLDPLTATHLRETSVGSVVRVVGYEWIYRGYTGKLLSLGLAPGVEFIVRCLRPHDGESEIELAGRRLTLGEAEANALVVEPIE
ncbi:MAG: ferrous iron transport protein A [Cyanobacteria bacterium J06641_5]